jgi:hypothetical protein
MSRRSATSMIMLACAALVLTGCMPKMTIEEMKAQMPKRPAELDRLDAFLGKWQFQGEATCAMLDQPLKSSGTTETKWDGDNWFIVSRSVMSTENFDDSKALETWTYDIKARKYRSTWVDSMGMMGMGVSTYDEKTDTWHMKATSYGPWGKSRSKGWVRFIDADHMKWWWVEYTGLMKTMEFNGTGERVK